MILAKPSTEVSGVRSSWLTVERKELLAASACLGGGAGLAGFLEEPALWMATPTAERDGG